MRGRTPDPATINWREYLRGLLPRGGASGLFVLVLSFIVLLMLLWPRAGEGGDEVTALLVAAVFLKLVFTAPADSTDPGRVAAYVGQRSVNGGRTWTATTLWRDSLGSGVPVPRMPGARDTVWVSVSTSRQALLDGGTLFQVRAKDVRGNLAAWSNRVVLAAFDTCAGLWRGPGALPVVSADLIGPQIRVQLAPGDTAVAKLVHAELVQAEDAERIIELYGYVALRGMRYASVGACWPAGRPRWVP